MGGKNEPGCVKQDLNGTLGTFSNPTVCQEAFHKLICQTDELSSVHGRLLLGLKTVSGPCKAELVPDRIEGFMSVCLGLRLRTV